MGLKFYQANPVKNIQYQIKNIHFGFRTSSEILDIL